MKRSRSAGMPCPTGYGLAGLHRIILRTIPSIFCALVLLTTSGVSPLLAQANSPTLPRSQATVSAFPATAAGTVIVLDPGHGGAETGAQYTFADGTTINEKDLNLRVALKVADKLTKAGYRPILTRTSDTQVNSPPQAVTGRYPIGLDDDLQARVDVANNSGAKLFLSIHFNGHPSSAKQGSEVYYCAEGASAEANQRFASLVLQNLLNGLAGADYPVDGRVRMDVEALEAGEHFFVLSPASDVVVRPIGMPAALAEGLFLTNEEDAGALRSEATLDAIAHAYALAIHQYFAGNASALPTRQNTSSNGATRTPAAIEGVVATDAGVGAKLRAEPSTAGEIVGSLADGATVGLHRLVKGEAVSAGDDRWYLVTDEGSQGYVYAALIQIDGATGSNGSGATVPRLGMVQTDEGARAFLRAAPSTTSNVVCSIPNGAEIDLLQNTKGEAVNPDNQEWFMVNYDGSEGYVYSDLVAEDTGATTISSTGPGVQTSSAGASQTNGQSNGSIQTQSGTGALLRAEPSTTSESLGAVGEHETITILGSVDGEDVVPGNSRWYRVSYAGNEGYIYSFVVNTD